MAIRFKTYFLFTLFFSLNVLFAFSQNYYVRNYTIADGLPTNSTKKIFKDSRGYLWISTDAGVVKYDGKSFEIFNTLDGLAGDNVWSIAEDNENNMWFGSYDGGVTKYNGRTIQKYTVKDGLVGENVRVVSYSKKFNFIFVGTETGFSIIKNGKISSFSSMSITGEKQMTIAGMMEGSDFIYVYSYRFELLKYYPGTNKIIPYGKQADISNGGGFVSAYVCSNNDTIFGYGRTGFSLFSDKRSDFKNIGQIFDFTEDSHNNIWIAAWSYMMPEPGGLFMFDGKTVTSFNQTFGIDSKAIWSVCYDKENEMLWVATEDKGIYSCSPSIFKFLKPENFNTQTLNVIDLLFVNDKLWILTPDFIFTRTQNGEIISYNISLFEKAYKESKVRLYKNNLKSFKHIVADNNDNIWIITDVGMFKMPDKKTNPIYFPVDYGYGECVSAFGYSNTYYTGGFGNFRSAEIIEPAKVKIKDYFIDEPWNVSKIIYHNDELWIGSVLGGLYKYKNGKTWAFNKKQTYLPKCVNDICIDKNENIIFGGTNGIIYIAALVKDTIQIKYKISKADGLNGQSVNWLKTSNNDKYLWIATNTGLNQLNLEKLLKVNKKEILFYNKDEGFANLNPASVTSDNNTNIWAGCQNGIIQVNINNDNFQKQQHSFIKLVNFEINHNPVNKLFPSEVDLWSFMPSKTIKLSYDQNNFNFTVDVINFINPDKDVFRHKLEGYETQWSNFDKSRKISYTNLPSGSYTLHVESKNLNSGSWAKPLTVKFSIGKPFWATWWFRILMILFVFTAVYSYIKFRTNRIKKQEQLKTEIAKTIAEYEMKALQAQMNPHFIFNAMNSIQNYILDNNTDKALSYLSDFAKLIRLTLEHASKKWITLSDKIEYLNNYLKLELMRFKNKFVINIVTNGLNTDNYLLPPMIIQPFVENAIKHGLTPATYKGMLMISFEKTNENLLCTVEDNGIGITKAAENNKNNINLHQPKGIDVTSKRLDLINDSKNKNYKIEIIDLTNEAKQISGTRVLIYLPLNIA